MDSRIDLRELSDYLRQTSLINRSRSKRKIVLSLVTAGDSSAWIVTFEFENSGNYVASDAMQVKGLVNPMMSCSLSPNVDDAKVADVVIPHVLRRPHVQGPQYMHKFLLVDRSSKL